MRGLAIVALGCGGCFYAFDSPVEAEPAGAVSGQLVLVNPAPGQTTANATVKLLWSGGLTVTVDATGRFSFLGLTDGTYEIAYEVPPLSSNDLPLLGFLPDVVLPDVVGSVNSVSIGQLQLAAGATVTGTVTGADGPVVVAAFEPDGGVYEGYYADAGPGGFTLVVPAGTHDLVASTSDLAATVTVTLSPGESAVQDFALAPVAGGGQVTGQVVFVGPGLGASAQAPTALTSGISFSAMQGNTAVGSGPVVAVSDGGASAVVVDAGVGAGQVVSLTLMLPSAAATDTTGPNGAMEGPYGPLTLPHLPLVAGRNTDLGQITWLPLSVFALNGIDAGF